MLIDMPNKMKCEFNLWKLKDPQICSLFQKVFKAHVPAMETDMTTTTQ